MLPFYFLDDEATADVAFIAQGESLNQAFENACLAISEVMVDLSEIEPKIEKKFELEAEDLQGLLYDLLDNLLFIFDTEDLIFCNVNCVINLENLSIKFHGIGEKYDPEKHQIKTHIKAVTFFGMNIENNRVKVTLDL